MCDSWVSWVRTRPYLTQAFDGESAPTSLGLEAIARSSRECLFPQPCGFEGFRVALEPAHPNHSAVAKSPDFAMRMRDLDVRRSTATTEVTQGNHLVAVVDDAVDLEASLLPGVEGALDPLIETIDRLRTPGSTASCGFTHSTSSARRSGPTLRRVSHNP
jgi:hypothetical protein